MKKEISLFLLICIASAGFSQSIAAYAAVDKKTSSHVAYYIAWACKGGNPSKIAKDELEKQGYNKTALSNIGYKSVTKGYFTLLKTESKNSDGSKLVSYRFGVDTSSMELSLKDALSYMPWSWTKKDGYEIVEQKSFSACEFNSLTCTLTFEKNGLCGNVIKSFSAKEEKITNMNQMQASDNKKYFVIPNDHTETVVIKLDWLCSKDKSVYSEIKFLSADTKEKLQKLLAQEPFNTPESKELAKIDVKYKSSQSKDETDNQGLINSFLKSVNSIIQEMNEKYCREFPNDCEAKKKKSIAIGNRG